MTDYDLIIVGAGPAGLTAGLFAGRRELKTLILGEPLKSNTAYATIIENYPGIKTINGQDFIKVMVDQAKTAGCEMKAEIAGDFELKGDVKKVKTKKGEYTAKAVIFAMGAAHRQLNVKGEEQFLGKGVSYCASCDGPLFKGKKVAVAGGSDAAVQTAIYLCDIASEVYLIHRRDELRAEQANQDKLFKTKAKVIWDSEVAEIQGDKFVNNLKIKNKKTEKVSDLQVEGLFIEIGQIPSSALAKKEGIKIDEKGFIIVNKDQGTNIPGVYAAGDLTGGLAQMASAVGEGSMAGTNAYFYISKPKVKTPDYH